MFVDGRMALRTGIGRHICGHVWGLCRSGIGIVAGVQSDAERVALRSVCSTIKTIPYGADIYSVRERVTGINGPRSVRNEVGVYWYPQYNVPWYIPKASVITIHDLIQFRFNLKPRSAPSILLGQEVLKRAVRQAAKIVCVSETTRGDLEEVIPGVSQKAVVIPNGVSEKWATVSDAARQEVVRQMRGIPFLLAVGIKKPHKNHHLLLRVIDRLHDMGYPQKLVLIGKPESAWMTTVAHWRSTSKAADKLVDLADASDDVLAAYYSAAQCFLMPSLYEGFGLPPLEAMMAGTPVVSSNRGALPETVGDAGILLNPLDVSTWVDSIVTLVEEPTERQRLIDAGRDRVRSFGWVRSSALLADTLREVAAMNR